MRSGTGVEKPDAPSSNDGERVGVMARGVPSFPYEKPSVEDGDGEERNSSTLEAEYDLLMLSMGMRAASRPV